jgi:hypothetical protein
MWFCNVLPQSNINVSGFILEEGSLVKLRLWRERSTNQLQTERSSHETQANYTSNSSSYFGVSVFAQ